MKIGSYGHVANRDRSAWVLYHNPKCSKSREALQILRENGIEPTIIEYLITPLNRRDLDELLATLKVEAKEIIRTKEKLFTDLKIDENDRDQVLNAIIDHPELLERPIVIGKNGAIIARPPEKILDLL